MRHCIVLRHVPFESLGLLEPLMVARGFGIQIIDVPVTPLPRQALLDAELLVVLGGPISVYEQALYPFLNAELEALAQRLRDEQATIGICLGAQLIAHALGAKVYRGAGKEIGWSPLQLTPSGLKSPLAAIDGQRVLHWHGDTFDLPDGADLLASTALTPHQAFAWRDVAVGLQFHLEVTARDLEAWYVGHALELSSLTSTNVPKMREAGQLHAARLEPHANRALAELLDRIA
jgi:GMP synthase (glutamine-hydrolysing)